MGQAKFILAFVFLLNTAITYSQNFKAGLIAGVSTSQVSGDQLAGFDKIGLAGGAFASLQTSDQAGWEMDILYVQKGSRKVADPDNGDYSYYLLALQYIEVPVLFKFTTGKFTYEFGPSFGTLVGQKEEDQFGERIYIPPRPFNDTEFSLNLGIRYSLAEKLSFDWRITNSILPIRPHVSGQTFRWNRGQYNTALLFLLHYEI